MKVKIKSLLLMMILFISFAYASAAMAESENTYMLLRTNNFTLPEGGGWTIQNDEHKYKYSIPGGYLKDSAWQGPGATADFYVADEGNYVIWAMVWDSSSGFGTRYGYVTVDGETDENKFQSSEGDAFTWSRSKKAFHLKPGLHRIALSTGYPSFCCSAVMITNDLEYVLNTETLYEDIAAYADTEPPSFNGEISVEADSMTSFTAVFPEATDNIGIASVKYFLNNEEIQIGEDMTYRAENVKPLSRYTLSAKASDGLGNSAEVHAEIDLARWKIGECLLKNTSGKEISGLSELTQEDTKFTVTVNIQKEFTGAGRAQLFAGVFTEDGKRMLVPYSSMSGVVALGQSVAKNINFDITPDFFAERENCMVKVILIDSSANIMACTEGVVIGGSEKTE